MSERPKFFEIRGLFASAHGPEGDIPPKLQDAPPVVYYQFFEVEGAIPVIVGFARADDAAPEDMFEEEGLEPVVAQQLRRAADGEWEWVLAKPDFMLTALNYGDRVDITKFRENVDLYLERRENPEAIADCIAVTNED